MRGRDPREDLQISRIPQGSEDPRDGPEISGRSAPELEISDDKRLHVGVPGMGLPFLHLGSWTATISLSSELELIV